MEYRTLNPATEELLQSFPLATDIEIERAIRSAWEAFEGWRDLSFASRSEPLLTAARMLEDGADDLGRLMAVEMGKPFAEGVAEAKKCALGCRYYAEHAAAHLRDDPRESDGSEAFVRYDPLGPVLAIMPWNFPFWQFFRFAAPALMAGNAVLLKHAPNTPRCARSIEALMREAGFPEGLVRSLFLSNEQAAAVIGDTRVRGVTLTGSTRAGREVAARAGGQLKTTVMELGGSDPFIVFDDADLGQAARVGVLARCQNSGQSCIAAKRFLVQRGVWDAFRERLVEAMRDRTVGDPFDPDVRIGPLARADLRDGLVRQVEASLAGGARALCGGKPLPGPGYFFPPTVLVGAEPGTPAADEELFGPVATLIPFEDEAEAVRLANRTAYGLGASLWTADVERARRLAGRIESGSVFVNGMVKSDPRLPFGGVKASGFGRELSREGILEFVNAKTVWIR
jgi:succinate-semialdehyde dehydrogenase/glutarate-semialdehyde dehydrogenase